MPLTGDSRSLVFTHAIFDSFFFSDSYLKVCSYFGEKKLQLNSDKCLKDKYRDVLLVITYNFDLYDSIPILLALYQNAFPNIYICGPNVSESYPVKQLPIYKGYFAYKCVAEAISLNDKYTGYLFLMDDVLLNFWTLLDLDKSKLWEGPKQPIQVGTFKPPDSWYWWNSRWGKDNCQRAFDELSFLANESVHNQIMVSGFLRNLQRNGGGRYRCHRGRSDIFYVPQRLAIEFTFLSSVFYKYKVFLEIAVPTMFRLLDVSLNFETLTGYYMPGRVGELPVTDSRYLWTLYNEDLNFIHPLKLHYGGNSTTNLSVLQILILGKVNRMTNCTELRTHT